MADDISKIVDALPTTIIGITVAYIAWQQWQTAKQKLRMDLFEKRHTVFERVLTVTNATSAKIYDESSVSESASWPLLIECWRVAREAHLLFGDSDVDRILQDLITELRELAAGTARRKAAEEEDTLDHSGWDHATNISKLQDKLFVAVEKYLQMGKIK